MAIIKKQDLKKMNKAEVDEKIKELKLELVKANTNASKAGNKKAKEIKKTIARIITFNKSLEEALNNK